MSYNQPPTKQFVKAKPLVEIRDKLSTSTRAEPKKTNKKYEQKSLQQNKDPRQHITLLLNQYQPAQKNQNIISLCQRFPKIFTEKPNKPQPEGHANYAELLFGTRKELPQQKYIKQLSSDSSDPDWDSDQEKQIKLASKKIDENVVQKVNTIFKKQPLKKIDQLLKHERQFLEEFNRQKRLQELQYEVQITKIQNKPPKIQLDQFQDLDKKNLIQKQQQADWAQCDIKVQALISGGLIQKIEQGDEDDADFSMQESQKSSSSDNDDDDMFADQGPRTVTKTKEDKKVQPKQTKTANSKQIVKVSNHFFTQIAQQAGLHPDACTWIISDKQTRYKVSTLYMNEYYQLETKLYEAFPYISLNHSDFVHQSELKTEKGIQKLKKINAHRRKNHNGFKNKVNPKPHTPLYKQKD